MSWMFGKVSSRARCQMALLLTPRQGEDVTEATIRRDHSYCTVDMSKVAATTYKLHSCGRDEPPDYRNDGTYSSRYGYDIPERTLK